jgi:hypothetical protein
VQPGLNLFATPQKLDDAVHHRGNLRVKMQPVKLDPANAARERPLFQRPFLRTVIVLEPSIGMI